MSEPIKISAVIITFNEESNIERLPSSLAGIVMKLWWLIVFRRTRTAEICATHGVRFIEHKFDGHIQQKNWAREQASHTYALS